MTAFANALARWVWTTRYRYAPRDAAAEPSIEAKWDRVASSIELSRERGSFPLFDANRFLAAPFVARLPAHLRNAVRQHGIRNSHLTAIAPAGTISLLAGNVSSGIEPIFAPEYERTVRDFDGSLSRMRVASYALVQWRARGPGAALPDVLTTAAAIRPADQLAMQAALQPYVDNAISKTTNVPAGLPYEDFAAIYRTAWETGLKGCTVFRPNTVTGAVLVGPEPRCQRCEPVSGRSE